MIGIRGSVGVIGCDHSRPAVVGHVFVFHRKGGRGWIFIPKCACEVKVGLEQWVEAYISTDAQPVVSISDIVIIPVGDIDIPAHQTHLQMENSMVGTVVG